MSASRSIRRRRCSPAAVVLLLATAMIAAGVGSRPVAMSGATVASDDRHSDSQPCEEPQDESSGDEETAAGKHSAIVGAVVSVDPPVAHGPCPAEIPSRLTAGALPDAPPIRGPPTRG